MADYQLTEDADNDLLEIARYTIKTWGLEQARHYEALLENHFRALSQKTITDLRKPLDHRSDLLASFCEHHYVFHLKREGQCPLIIAVLHENMELLVQIGGSPFA